MNDVRIRFQWQEILHLAGGVLILTVAFGFVLHARELGADATLAERLNPSAITFLASFLGVASGFVFHELAHKLVAQYYGHWAEFRANFLNLVISLAFAVGLGVLVAAPGAVQIWGRVTRRENGLISIVGPAVNVIIAAIVYPFTLVPNTEGVLYQLTYTVAFVNALLAVLNMLPFWVLDGRKVLRWNVWVFIPMMLLTIGVLVVVWMGLPL